MTSADEILARLDAPAVLAAANTRRQRTDKTPGLPAPPPSADPAMFRGILGDLAHAADPTTEADPAGVLASLLAGAGAAAGPKPHVQVGNTRHPLLIWPLLFGRTGSGRKGEATDTAEMFLRAAVWDWADISVTGLSSGEGLIERIRDPQSEEDDGGTMDKRLCVTETEFSTVMARAKREGSTLGTVLRQAWDARTLAVLTRVAYKASMPHVAIIGHIPPKEFRMRLAESDMVGGSYNRFLPVYVERSKKLPIPQGIPEPLLGAEATRLRQAIGAASDLGRIHLGEHATRLWSADLYDEFTAAGDDDQAWTEFTRRPLLPAHRRPARRARRHRHHRRGPPRRRRRAGPLQHRLSRLRARQAAPRPPARPHPPRYRQCRSRRHRPHRHLRPVLPQRHPHPARRTPGHPDQHRPVRDHHRPDWRAPLPPLPPHPRDEERRKN
jgi:hypothetical protein